MWQIRIKNILTNIFSGFVSIKPEQKTAERQVQMTYPGVYVQEVLGAVRTIAGVDTSVTAFLGRALRGPVNEPENISSFIDFENRFGGLWIESTMSFAVRDFFLNGGSHAIIVRLINGAAKSKYEIPSSLSPDKLLIVAANPGAWGDSLTITIDHNTRSPSDLKLFNMIVSETGRSTEAFLNVSCDEGSPDYLPKLLEQRSALIRIIKTDSAFNMPVIRPDAGQYTISYACRGSDGLELTIEQYCEEPGQEDRREGLWALEKADLFNLLCIPPYSPGVNISKTLINKAIGYCTKRRAVMIIDPPANWTSSALALSGFASYPDTISSNAAIYFPRLKQPNPLKANAIEEFVACGAIAGVIAKTDSMHGVWKAPAGTDAHILGISGLCVIITDSENGAMNPLGINCLRSFPDAGYVIWGSRTLAGTDNLGSEWKYLSVRRTALFIEESLARGLEWVVFEPNDEPLWAQIRLNVGAFMNDLFKLGAFQGNTPREAYFVKCDKETTTQHDIITGIVNVLVGFAPLRPAEFVMLRIQLKTGWM